MPWVRPCVEGKALLASGVPERWGTITTPFGGLLIPPNDRRSAGLVPLKTSLELSLKQELGSLTVRRSSTA